MADTPQSGLLSVRLVTPDRILLDATAEAVELPSMTGYLEALYGAAPLLAELGAGEVRLHGGTSGDQKFFVAWGFVEVLPERVTLALRLGGAWFGGKQVIANVCSRKVDRRPDLLQVSVAGKEDAARGGLTLAQAVKRDEGVRAGCNDQREQPSKSREEDEPRTDPGGARAVPAAPYKHVLFSV